MGIIDKNIKFGDFNENEISISKEFFKMKEELSILPSVKIPLLECKSESILEKYYEIESEFRVIPYDFFQNKRILLLIHNGDIIKNEPYK